MYSQRLSSAMKAKFFVMICQPVNELTHPQQLTVLSTAADVAELCSE